MDWRTLVAIVLMVVVYFFTFPPAPPTQKPADTNQTTEVSSEAKSVTQSASTAASPQIKAASPGSDEALRNQILKWASEERVIETPELIAKMNALGELRSVSFRQYPVEPKSKELVSRDFSKIGGFNRAVLKAAGVEVLWSSQKWTDRGIQLSGRVGSLEIERTIELAKDQYALIAKDSIKNLGTSSAEASLELRISEELVPSKQSGFLMRILKPQTDFQKAVWFQKDSLDYAMFEQISQKRLESTEGLSWAGFSDKYFLYGLIPQNSSFKNLDLRNVGGRIEQQAEMMPKQIAPAEKMDFEYTYYIGPKKLSDLEAINPTLSRAIEYGNWIGPISRGLLAILHFFYSLVHNYGIAIILLTLLVKIVLLPLAYKSAVSMRKLSLVQPKMMEIREKYKKDPQRMNVEMMNL